MEQEYEAGLAIGTEVATGFLKGTMNQRDRNKLSTNPYPVDTEPSRKLWRTGFATGYENVMNTVESAPPPRGIRL